MLKWMKRYYIGERIPDPVAVQEKITARKFVPGIYLITLSNNPNNLLEIISASMLCQRAAYEICPMIIGMAKGKEDAISMLTQIIEEVYQNTGTFHMEEYFMNR